MYFLGVSYAKGYLRLMATPTTIFGCIVTLPLD